MFAFTKKVVNTQACYIDPKSVCICVMYCSKCAF